jgi:hypothetical protein
MNIATSIVPQQALASRLEAPFSLDLRANVRAAMDAGRRIPALMREVMSLYRGPGQLTPHEYFYYRLWDTEIDLAAKRRYVGKAVQMAMHHACNDIAWGAVARDKLLSHAVITAAGLPTPRLRAVVHPSRMTAGAAALTDHDAVLRFLRDPLAYPFFGKPIDGMFSLGVLCATAYDPGTDTVRMTDGLMLGAEDLAGQLVQHQAGYLLQDILRPHPVLAALIGNRLCSIRFLVLLGAEELSISSAVCKIPAGSHIADNYWRQGNLLGAVDHHTGEIGRIVSGTALDLRVGTTHPDTGSCLSGTRITDWAAACGLVLRAAHIFPAIRNQSWDIAITAEGPMILEVNWGGDLNLHQLAHGQGILGNRFTAHLRRCGYEAR